MSSTPAKSPSKKRKASADSLPSKKPKSEASEPGPSLSTASCALKVDIDAIKRLYPTPLEQAAALIRASSRIMVIAGAGMSTAAGISDYRSPNGLYSQIEAANYTFQVGNKIVHTSKSSFTEAKAAKPPTPEPTSPSPSASSGRPRRAAAIAGEKTRQEANPDKEGRIEVFDPQDFTNIKVFSKNPALYYTFAHKVFPGQYQPTLTHHWLKKLEASGKLLRLYTQNVDTLEQKAGLKNYFCCHGSYATASCLRCKRQVSNTEIRDAVMKQEIAWCKTCPPPTSTTAEQTCEEEKGKGKGKGKGKASAKGKAEVLPVMRPDIVMFGEDLSPNFFSQLEEDEKHLDLLIVIGTSLKVYPIQDVPLRHRDIPQILINFDQPPRIKPDIWLKGPCDDNTRQLAQILGWDLPQVKCPA